VQIRQENAIRPVIGIRKRLTSTLENTRGFRIVEQRRWRLCLIELRLSVGSVAGSLASGRCGSPCAACSNCLRLIPTMPPCLPSIRFSSLRISNRRFTTPRLSMASDSTSIAWHEADAAGSGTNSACGGDSQARRVCCVHVSEIDMEQAEDIQILVSLREQFCCRPRVGSTLRSRIGQHQ
jgi:hypothetical protein